MTTPTIRCEQDARRRRETATCAERAATDVRTAAVEAASVHGRRRNAACRRTGRCTDGRRTARARVPQASMPRSTTSERGSRSRAHRGLAAARTPAERLVDGDPGADRARRRRARRGAAARGAALRHARCSESRNRARCKRHRNLPWSPRRYCRARELGARLAQLVWMGRSAAPRTRGRVHQLTADTMWRWAVHDRRRSSPLSGGVRARHAREQARRWHCAATGLLPVGSRCSTMDAEAWETAASATELAVAP